MHDLGIRTVEQPTEAGYDAVVAEWQSRVRDAAGRGVPLEVRGGGTKCFYGEPPMGEGLDTRAYRGVIDYDPTELVITARAGTPLDEIEAVLSRRGQMLAFEPPHFGPGATLGGAIAAGLSGPRRPHAGAARDVVLGVRLIDGQGCVLSFGGRVMKNVAGFDVSRVMAGALGTLGLLLDVSLKCLPAPRAETTLVFEQDAARALSRMREWAGRPLPLSGTCHWRGKLHVRLAGSEAAVDAAVRNLGGEAMPEGPTFWRALRDHALAPLDGASELWRLSVRPTAPVLDVPGEQVIEWGGAERWVASRDPLDPAMMRAVASEHGGHATLFRAERRREGVFHPLAPAVREIHRRLKATFDPAGILNRGRLYPDL